MSPMFHSATGLNHVSIVAFSNTCIFLDAASAGDIQTMTHLLQHGVDPNVSNTDGLTALHQVHIIKLPAIF